MNATIKLKICRPSKILLLFGVLIFLSISNSVYAQDSDGDGVADNVDLDDDNDGILDVDEGLQIVSLANLNQVSAIPTGTYPGIGSSDGLRLSDATGNLVLDIYKGTNTSPGEVILFNTSTGQIQGSSTSGTVTNSEVVELVYTTVNSPVPFQLEDITINDIQSLDVNTIRDAYVWSEPGGWTPQGTGGSSSPAAAVIEVDPVPANKVGVVSTLDPDGGNTGFSYTVLVFSQVYAVDNTLSNVLVNMSGAVNGHTVDFAFDSPHTTASLYVFNAGGAAAYWSFFPQLTVSATIDLSTDTDNDGIPDYQDLDSDGDGCGDAIEGAGTLPFSDLQPVVAPATLQGGNADTGNGLYNGTSTTPFLQNLGTNSVTTTGSPLLGVPIPISTGTAASQGVGASIDGTPSASCTVDTDGDGINDNTDTDINDPCDPAQAAGYTGYDASNAIWAAADCDGDGVTNGEEATNGTDPYATSGDTDGDGIDDDNEINNGTDENNPCDPAQAAGYTGYDASNAIWAAADCDGDGVTNGEEATNGTDPYATSGDTDGDGIDDDNEINNGTDENNPCDPAQAAGYTGYDASNAIWAAADCDGDGVTNGEEATNGTDPYATSGDTDGDGIDDDNEINNGTDENNPCDPAQAAGYTGYDATNAIWAAADCDGDGVTNGEEATNGTDPYAVSGDTDGDGIDDDNEINNGTDENNPCDPAQAAGYTGYDASNAIWAAADCDGDGVTNGEEATNGTDPYAVSGDTDGDGIDDDNEINNGTDENNPCDPAQAAGYTGYDATNAIWAAADCDGDGVTNGEEATNGTDPYAVSGDTDGDGIDDDNEINNGTDENNPCDPAQAAGYTGYDATNPIWAAADCDGDGVTNGEEATNGTDPYAVSGDTDGDGIDDDNEINNGTDENNPCDPAQAAGYTGYDASNAIWAAADCDGDGVTNGEEATNGTDPYAVSGDTDGDGINDDNEINNGTDQNDPCDPAQAAGYTGYDATNPIWAAADCNGDGVTNGDEDTNGTDPYASLDTDGDGILDSDEITNGTDENDPCDPAQAAGYTGYDASNAKWAAADCDGDGVTNGEEATNGTDPYATSGDTDGDGIDDDNEINNGTDENNPCDPAQAAGYTGYDASNAIWAAADCDGDGVTNGEEATNGTDPYATSGDTDGDGIDDDNEINNGTDENNPCDPAQAAGYTGYDASNAIWAAADCDGDGVTNGEEATNGTDPYATSGDTDGDGIDDDNEINNGTDENNPCDPAQAAGYTGYDASNAIWAAADCDGDGVTNGEEATNGTDPYATSGDTDGDGIDDDNEINNGTDENNPCDPAQAAGYTGYDASNAIWAAADCDGDGVTNGDEDTNGTDPYAVSGDTDGDGINDDNEINNGTDQNDPCDPAQAAGYTGYDATNPIWAAADCDGDGVTNGDEDTNGTDPYAVSGDTDGDGINDDNEINNGTDQNDPCDPAQAAGYTGYDATNPIWAAADCDGDGVTNQEELDGGSDPNNRDTDGDGINDNDELTAGSDENDPCDPAQQSGYTGYDDTNMIWQAADCDGDGVTNGQEFINGTDPYAISEDTDGDGIDDDNEINDGTERNDPCDPVQTAGYTGYDATNPIWAAANCDGDDFSNGEEVANGTDPYETDVLSLAISDMFTPNGDGINDTWFIQDIEEYPGSIVKVYNRWGHEVFGAVGYRNDWDAIYKDNSEKLPPGSYYYVINLGDGSPPIDGWIFINY